MFRGLWVFIVLGVGCASAPAPVVSVSPPPGDPHAALRSKLEDLEERAVALARAQDDALWKHFIAGAIIDLPALTRPFLSIPTRDSLETLRAARREKLKNPAALLALERFVAGQALALGLEETTAATDTLESTLNYSVAGKAYAFRALDRTLAAEKSATRRRALWSSALGSTGPLLEMTLRAERQLQSVSAALGFANPRDMEGLVGGVSVESAQAIAEKTLAATDAAWTRLLLTQLKELVQLPRESVTAADFPRALASPELERLFTKASLVPRTLTVLGALGLSPRPGLLVDLRDEAKKIPLPLTVALPGDTDVRVSVRPQPGFKPLQLAFDALGRGAALALVPETFNGERRFSPPLSVDATGHLLAGLVRDPGWLLAVTSERDAATRASNAACAEWLLRLRLMCAEVLIPTAPSDELAWEVWRSLVQRAMAVPISPLEARLFWLRRGTLHASARSLLAQVQGEDLRRSLRQRFGPSWWKEPQSGETLVALLKASSPTTSPQIDEALWLNSCQGASPPTE